MLVVLETWKCADRLVPVEGRVSVDGGWDQAILAIDWVDDVELAEEGTYKLAGIVIEASLQELCRHSSRA